MPNPPSDRTAPFDAAKPCDAPGSAAGRTVPRPLAARALACLLAVSLVAQAPAAASASATGLVSTERLVQSLPATAAATGEAARAALLAALDRQEVAQALADRGLSVDRARERVAALTDDEARALAERIDLDPAGASEIISTIVFIFVLLLITDILGFTKIFPFTRAIR